jgi:hypothetical protein
VSFDQRQAYFNFNKSRRPVVAGKRAALISFGFGGDALIREES